jgi:predicted nucleotidyltransferase
MNVKIELPRESIEAFCRKWLIARIELFGSVLREDFRQDSDIDFLVTFAPESHWSLFDLVTMELELTETIGRKVDMICRESVEQSHNPIRRKAILESAEQYYAA